MRKFGRIIILIFAIFGVVGFFVTVGGVVGIASLASREASLPDHFVLALNLDNGLSEGSPDSPFEHYATRDSYMIDTVIEDLEQAENDPRVTALVARIGDTTIGMAQAEQIRRAVLNFSRSKKPTYLFSESFGGTVSYYIATAFDEIWLQPSGDVGLRGFMAESPFLKTTLEVLGVDPVFSTRHEYKSAPEMFTGTNYSAASKETLSALLTSWSHQVVAGAAERRRLKPNAISAAIDKAPLLAREALAAGLVDRLGYADELKTVVTTKTGSTKRVELQTYHGNLKSPSAKAPKIALIHGIGAVMRGESRFGGLTENAVMGSRTVSKAFADATQDKDVAAIVFRVDSPGGDYVAADTIWREVKRAREKGKPVIVTMGNVAASGGYFVAMPATKIIAEAGTITGSIGVFAGKFVLRNFWEKLGVHWGEVHVGANAPMWSTNRDFTPDQRLRFESMLDTIYADFTAKAAEGRSMTLEQIDHVARGRVFSGADALRLGLVDALGGIDTAIEEARKAAKLTPDEPIRLTPFPAPKPFGEALIQALTGGEIPTDIFELGTSASESELKQVLGLLKPLLRHVDAAHSGVLRSPPLDVQ